MQVEEMQEPDIPVTILTGFLGAGIACQSLWQLCLI